MLLGRALPVRDSKLGRELTVRDSTSTFFVERTLELAVLLCVHASDTSGFQRNMSQLKAYYGIPRYICWVLGASLTKQNFDDRLAAESNLRQMILGLYLLFLIVENRLAEFHSEVRVGNGVHKNGIHKLTS